MDDASNDRALVVLLGILADPNTWIGKRMEAAGALLSYEAPPEVVDTAKQFLLGVAEDERPEFVALRLKALKLLRQAEARRIRPRATRTHHAKEAPASLFHGLADAVKRASLTAPIPREVDDGPDGAA